MLGSSGARALAARRASTSPSGSGATAGSAPGASPPARTRRHEALISGRATSAGAPPDSTRSRVSRAARSTWRRSSPITAS